MTQPAARLALAAALVLVTVATSGCLTQLGYVPGYAKGQNASQAPTYGEVRSFAVDTRNGYDTRMTLNRYAGYFGALLAGGAASAMTGLAAFDSGSSALVGIPIGTAFLGGVAGVFHNEEKARVYGSASRYLTDLITLSDDRVKLRQWADANPTAALEIARRTRDAAEKDRKATQTRLRTLQKLAAADLDAVANETDEDQRKVRQERANASQKNVEEAVKAEAAAAARAKSAGTRLVRAEDRQKAGKPTSDDSARNALEAEATCLQKDVNAVNAKVAALLHPLDPNAQRALLAVRAPDAAGSTPPTTTPATETADKPPVLVITGFDLPAASVCSDDI